MWCEGGLCVCVYICRVLCLCVESVCGVCAEGVCGMIVLCVVCCSVLLCVCRDVLCWCWCWCAMCGAFVSVGVCVWMCVVSAVCCVWCVWRGLARRKPPVCRFRTDPCMPEKRPHVFNMRAFCQYTRKRFEPTRGDVLNLHTEKRKERGVSLLSRLLFSSLFPLLSSLSSLSDEITRPIGLSLCTHGSDLPENQSAFTLAHSLFGEHVRIMQETTVLEKLCKPRATWNEVGLHLCWNWVLCLVVLLVVFGCVGMRWYAMICVVFVVLLVAVDALAVVW